MGWKEVRRKGVRLALFLVALLVAAWLMRGNEGYSIQRAREAALKQNVFTLRHVIEEYTLDQPQAASVARGTCYEQLSRAGASGPDELGGMIRGFWSGRRIRRCLASLTCTAHPTRLQRWEGVLRLVGENCRLRAKVRCSCLNSCKEAVLIWRFSNLLSRPYSYWSGQVSYRSAPRLGRLPIA